MSRQLDVQQAAIAALITAVNGDYPIKLPNRPFVTPETTWLRFSYLPNQPVQVALGANGKDVIAGVFQVDVFAPKGSGRNGPLGIVDYLCNSAFKSGLRYTINDGEVLIRSSGLTNTLEDTAWYQLIITIEFTAYLARTTS